MGVWLIFFLICFAGIVFMFYCVLRRQDAILKALRDEHAQFRVSLRALGARLDANPGFGSGFTEGEYSGESRDNAPISVDEALDAYARKERQDKDARVSAKSNLPDLKF